MGRRPGSYAGFATAPRSPGAGALPVGGGCGAPHGSSPLEVVTDGAPAGALRAWEASGDGCSPQLIRGGPCTAPGEGPVCESLPLPLRASSTSVGGDRRRQASLIQMWARPKGPWETPQRRCAYSFRCSKCGVISHLGSLSADARGHLRPTRRKHCGHAARPNNATCQACCSTWRTCRSRPAAMQTSATLVGAGELRT